MDAFLEQRHARFSTPQAEIAAVVRRALGVAPLDLRRVIKGYDSEVYLARMPVPPHAVVRIRQHGDVSYSDEAWAIEASRRAGAPVPRIYWVDTIETPGGPREVMVQEQLDGQALSDLLPQLRLPQLDSILQEAGGILRRIHAVPADGFYRRHQGRWDFPSWDRVMESAVRDRSAERPFYAKAGFSDAEIDRLLGYVTRLKTEFRCEQPVLCHGDYLPAHIFLGPDGHVSGIIDFGNFHGGDPADDFALLAMECPELDLAPLVSGYFEAGGVPPDFAERVALHRVTLILGYLAHHMRIGDAAQANVLAERLRRLV